MTDSLVPAARKLTKGLIDFLVEVTQASERNPEPDIFYTDQYSPWQVLWVEDIPTDSGKADLTSEDVLFSMRPSVLKAAPRPPDIVQPWLDASRPWNSWTHEPRLSEPTAPAVPGSAALSDPSDIASPAGEAKPSRSIAQEYERWLATWHAWAREGHRIEQSQKIYDFLDGAGKEIEQRDDEHELVLARGLVRWITPDGRTLRRHLVTEQVLPLLDRRTARVTVHRIGAALRYEDSQLFGEVVGYEHDRAEDVRQALHDAFEMRASADRCLQLLAEWTSRCTGTAATTTPPFSHTDEPGLNLELSLSPAFILRPRSKVLLAEAYKRIARELKDPDTPLPVALSQLVVDTEAEQRQQWIELQHGVTGNFLGEDPRFPLDVNPEQERVMALLRTESNVVVQGPPGTGKTHTIANLVSALLARGQRILVTSQKDQALRVLRDKIPRELRHLCVLLAGGSKDASVELQQGLDALSEAVATSDRAALRREAGVCADERVRLRNEAAQLNAEIRDLRETENKNHGPVVPWSDEASYSGTLSEIVRQIKQQEPKHGWVPTIDTGVLTGPPPMTETEFRRLHALLRSDSDDQRARANQWIPEPGEIPNSGQFTQLTMAERMTDDSARAVETTVSRQLATLKSERLARLEQLREPTRHFLLELGFDETGQPGTAPEWVRRALDDLFAGQHDGLWRTLFEVRNEASRIQAGLRARGVTHVVDVTRPQQENLGAARGALAAGKELQRFLQRGGKMRKRFPSKEQSNAEAFLNIVQVDGQRPVDLETVVAAIPYLEAEVATLQLLDKWADCGVNIRPDRLTATLSQLADNGKRIDLVNNLMGLRRQVMVTCEAASSALAVNSLASLLILLEAIPAALARMKYNQSHAKLEKLHESVQIMASRSDACPETAQLPAALGRRDTKRYEDVLKALDTARAERAQAIQLAELSRRLNDVHPRLLSMLAQTAGEECWDDRIPGLAQAWAWHQASQFVATQRSAERERELTAAYMRIEDQIQNVTARLAATEAMLACLEHMSDDNARALRTYREHMANVGAGSGRRVQYYRQAARAAMQKAKTAVPAWVVPLPNLLENLPADRNSFDVVIVDEASQVGMEQLFLLWLAPRVIIVGDNKQCTPGETRLGKHEWVFQNLSRYLGDADPDIQTLFTPKTNLYGLLSARSGKDSVIRLREHFRCVPEIINWPSTQFYSVNGIPGLVPLRERRAGDLQPLVVQHIDGGYTEGSRENLRNPVEAKKMADQLVTCLANPSYKEKTFGMVVLQGRGQVKLLDHEINVRISPEERENRKIRVGTASDFQGDERDVVFLSMVVADPPRAQKWTMAQQAYNVAVSRAKDQLWLFTSLTMDDLKSDDLRASLLDYMQHPPSVYGPSPSFDAVSENVSQQPFESLLEQRVFREIRSRNYHVVPQYAIGSRRIDLVVVGDGTRVAVECDGHRYHTSPDQIASDARRDRDLNRMKWEVIRIRESEFEFDRTQELAPLWTALDARGIRPGSAPEHHNQEWAPVPLPNDDEDSPSSQEGDGE